MQGIWDQGITFILSLQSLGGWLTGPMNFFSFLGTLYFFLLVAPALYWCVDASLGLRFGLFLMVSSGLNSIFKLAFHAPRPYWIDLRVKALSSETSFGIPSGHAQNAVVVWSTLARPLRKTWAWIAAFIVIFLISISRLYLGVHFPTDVLAGWVIGVILLVVIWSLEKPVGAWLARSGLGVKLAAALAVSVGLIFLALLAQALLATWQIPEQWIINALQSTGVLINPLMILDVILVSGAFFGLAAGAALLPYMGGFDAGGTWWQRLSRYILGLAGILILYLGMNAIHLQGETASVYFLRYIQFSLVGLWISGLAPWVFVRLGLAAKTNQQKSRLG
jgi:membrane-associated phospholipid phosphatase